jgi:hypothetical protein
MQRLSKGAWTTIFLVAAVAVIPAQVRELPAGWIRAGSKPADYEMAVDAAAGRTGAAAFIKSRTVTPAADGFGTLMQSFTAAEYRGKRLRLSGYVKATGISNWAGLWMRVDGPTGQPLAFDNMQGRPIKGRRIGGATRSSWTCLQLRWTSPLASSSPDPAKRGSTTSSSRSSPATSQQPT